MTVHLLKYFFLCVLLKKYREVSEIKGHNPCHQRTSESVQKFRPEILKSRITNPKSHISNEAFRFYSHMMIFDITSFLNVLFLPLSACRLSIYLFCPTIHLPNCPTFGLSQMSFLPCLLSVYQSCPSFIKLRLLYHYLIVYLLNCLFVGCT
jgi:hypothetical protein